MASSARILIFTGGSGSNHLGRELDRGSFAVTHVISVFDNGGSTGKLRKVTGLPAMGDIRNRLCALADVSDAEVARMRDLFSRRLSNRKSEQQLRHELGALISGDHSLLCDVRDEHRAEIVSVLRAASHSLPPTFQLADMSLGNLLIVGATRERGSFIAAIDWARNLLGVASRVLPVTLESAHLGASTDIGDWVIGQAEITRETSRLRRRITDIALLRREDTYVHRAHPPASPEVLEAIRTADVIVFGFGSFYTSILPQLLVRGVAAALAARRGPTVLLCNATADRETEWLTFADMLSIVTANGKAVAPHFSGATDALYLTGDAALTIPLGDPATFAAHGCQLRIEAAGPTMEAIARTASRTIAEIAGVTPHTIDPPARQGEDAYPVVCFDLDHTLFDYTWLRREATVAALEGLCRSPSMTADFLLRELVPPLTDVLSEWDLPNFRREWNSTVFYALACVCDDASNRNAVVDAFDIIRSVLASVAMDTSFAGRRTLRIVARRLRSRSVVTTMLRAISGAKQRTTDLHAARQRFDQFAEANAGLAPGGHELLVGVREKGAAVCIVTEGASAIQHDKVRRLALAEMVDSVVVTDRAMGVLPLVEALFEKWGGQPHVPDYVEEVYDHLYPYTVKSESFYARLLHALAADGPVTAARSIEEPRFVSAEEWTTLQRPRVAMVGDQYRRDVEPLLAASSRGTAGFRILSGKYAADDPLHDVIAAGRATPVGYFPTLAAASNALLGWVQRRGAGIGRPEPSLPSIAALDQCRRQDADLSPDAVAALEKLLMSGALDERL